MESLDPLVRNRMDDWGDLLTCEGVISPSQGGKAPAELEDGEGSLPLELNTRDRACRSLPSPGQGQNCSTWASVSRGANNGKESLLPKTASRIGLA